jgi:uncharacterized protein DUF4105
LRFLVCLSVALALVAGAAPARAQADVSSLVRQARAKELARDPYWLRLLHYRRTLFGGVASDIVSPEFFLAPGGATDPVAELTATLTAMFEPPGPNPDDHPQCRFVARYKWLRRSLEWGTLTAPAVPCPRYSAYTSNGQIESLSLVYATGYLSNPASFFGHILLKFNTSRTVVASELLDQSLNSFATVPPAENPVAYVLKGLFGGYDSTFSHEQFFAFNHLYVENDLRDLWEYELALTRDEVDQLVSHSWEILGKRHVYYFMKENCAYRMAKLLELVINEPLLPDAPWSLPGVVFERISRLEHHGAPLVGAVRRIPSRQNRLRGGFMALTDEQRSEARELVDHDLDLERPAYRALSDSAKIGVIDTLLDYYEYRIEMVRAKHRLLIERTALPARRGPAANDAAQSSGAAPPHEGPLPFMLRAGAVRNSRFGTGIKLRARPVNYDALALDAGRIPHSTLTMFDLELVRLDQHWRLRRFDVVKVEHLNMSSTWLPADGGWAWKFRAGLESQDLDCRACTVAKAEGALGRAVELSPRLAGFAMLDGWVQTEHANSGTLGTAARIGVIATPTPAWKTQLELGRRKFLNGERRGERMVRWENRFGGERRWDVRVGYEQHVARELSAGLSLYW